METPTCSPTWMLSNNKDIDAWMHSNMLKLNKDKIELLVIGSQYRLPPSVEDVIVAGERIERLRIRSEILE